MDVWDQLLLTMFLICISPLLIVGGITVSARLLARRMGKVLSWWKAISFGVFGYVVCFVAVLLRYLFKHVVQI